MEISSLVFYVLNFSVCFNVSRGILCPQEAGIHMALPLKFGRYI